MTILALNRVVRIRVLATSGIILFSLFFGFAPVYASVPCLAKQESPEAAARNIINCTLTALQNLHQADRVTTESVIALIETNLLPHIDLERAANLTLPEHWDSLSQQERAHIQNYIRFSLINDYASLLLVYEDFSEVLVNIDSQVKRKENLAAIKILVTYASTEPPIEAVVKLFLMDQWRAYDISFSGVSLMKGYRSQFDSHIKRKGLPDLLQFVAEES